MLACVLSYLFGSIDFAYVIARLHHIKLDKFGDGNLGATNLMYALMKKKKYSKSKALFFFLFVGFLDGLKTFIPTLLLGPFAGIFAILGHCFSIFTIPKTKKIPSGVGLASSIGWILAVDYKMMLPVGIVFLPFLFYFGKFFEKERGHIYSIFAYPFGVLLYMIWQNPTKNIAYSLVLMIVIIVTARLIKIKRFLETCLK
ncbi:MAG: glycerol-3-phosphate acyltransferase [Candidatus Aenigmarchaeota archaeon]|nr:glycerol-3-phosphate acyltransferase [Candidatus Aenigmarchaeota archaeon]